MYQFVGNARLKIGALMYEGYNHTSESYIGVIINMMAGSVSAPMYDHADVWIYQSSIMQTTSALTYGYIIDDTSEL